MIKLDPRKTWWWERQTQTRLTKWAVALLQGRRYSVRLCDKGSSYIQFEGRIIQINAQMFPKQTIPEQFCATQGLIAHEVGHAFFTQAWPGGEKDNRLREMTNFLEDQRIERAICIYYPGITDTIHFLGNLMLERIGPVRKRPVEQVYLACLAWRWASGRIPEAQMLERMEIEREGCLLWTKVRPWVEQAWGAVDTAGVIHLSRQILAALGIEDSSPPMQPEGLWNDDLPIMTSEAAQPFPDGPCSATQPGKGKGLAGSETFQADSITTPAPYSALESQAIPFANQLVEELHLPAQEVDLAPDEWGGRYSFRQEMRTPETPHLVRRAVGCSSQDLAIHILVDRSGSMAGINEDIRLSLMSLYLACMELGVPLGISYFGADEEKDQTLQVSAPLTSASEGTKALIAGYEGKTSNEFLAWGLREAEDNLGLCHERTKVILVAHDGEPVYHGPLGNDWELSHAAIRRLMKAGYLVIGIFLYQRGGADHARLGFQKLKKLFPNLVDCDQQQFARKLGNFLRSLAHQPGAS